MRRKRQRNADWLYLAAVGIAIAGLLVYWALTAIYGWMLYLPAKTLATWAMLATFAAPALSWIWYKAGQRVGLEADLAKAREEGYRAGAKETRRLRDKIQRMREDAREHGHAYLDGAKRGLGIAERVATTREVARPRRQEPSTQNVVVLPNVTEQPFQVRAQNDDEVIDI